MSKIVMGYQTIQKVFYYCHFVFIPIFTRFGSEILFRVIKEPSQALEKVKIR